MVCIGEFLLVPVNPHQFRTISCTVIKSLFKHVSRLLKEEIFPNTVRILWLHKHVHLTDNLLKISFKKVAICKNICTYCCNLCFQMHTMGTIVPRFQLENFLNCIHVINIYAHKFIAQKIWISVDSPVILVNVISIDI
jgi:hypothetical protein